MDPVFQEEQEHLSEAYAKLLAARERLSSRLERNREEAAKDLSDMRDELVLDKSSDVHTETMAELESMNRLVDVYNRTDSIFVEELRHVELLLKQPYFAKVRLKFKSGRVRDVYLGTAGATDESQRHFIVDWRSPVAETYYNQSNGPTSYVANGKTIEVDLELRRQFDLTRDKLNAYFDTTVAIEDPLLLQSLSKRRSEKLTAITATIQKEQNEVVRHEDVPALVVNGIAGSGKTSVLLQRIAYLFYQERENLRPDQVYLFTPNPVFEKYIDHVLPDMGERNPQIFTWKGFIERLGLADRGLGLDTPEENLRKLERGMETLALDVHDFRDIRRGDVVLLRAQQFQALLRKYSHIPPSPHLFAVINEELHDRLDSRLGQLVKDARVQGNMLDLDVDSKIQIFGSYVDPQTDEEIAECAKTYVDYMYAGAHEDIDASSWVRIDRIGMRLLGKETLASTEWIYLKMLLTGECERDARYVMLDEVQDYTVAQLMVLARYFPNAHFLLLGDQHQAINEGTATFDDVRRVFAELRGKVDECRLMTSYRSSPEITALFTGLLEEDERIKTSSVHRPGIQPRIEAFAGTDEYLQAVRAVVDEALEADGLTAIVVNSWEAMKWLSSRLDERVKVLHSDEELPATGVILLDLPLAKGLEFDHVVVPDATGKSYPDTPLARRRLYTALSRATHKVTVLAHGELTPLLK
ncbi:MAG: HelD family protein [Coriobacteriales bacterium]